MRRRRYGSGRRAGRGLNLATGGPKLRAGPPDRGSGR